MQGFSSRGYNNILFVSPIAEKKKQKGFVQNVSSETFEKATCQLCKKKQFILYVRRERNSVRHSFIKTCVSV